MAHIRARIAVVLAIGLVGVCGIARSASAQPAQAAGSDLSGSWTAINNEDLLERVAGPFLVDYTGLALNAEGRALALSTSLSRFQTIERQCQLWPPDYLVFGPFGMKIWSTTDPISGATVAWHIGAWEDRAETVIWMDGRPHPSANAPHTRAGFWTGEWRGNTLVTHTTHVKAGVIRRNGAQTSDRATYTTDFIRHGDRMTVVLFVEDPIYLSEPQVFSKDFQLGTSNALLPVGPPCVAGYEGTPPNSVPQYLPGTNPATGDLLKAYGIPREAALGGAETMYPEYRKKLEPVYVRPEKCLQNCGGPRGGGPGGLPPGAPAPAAPGGRGSGPGGRPGDGRSASQAPAAPAARRR